VATPSWRVFTGLSSRAKLTSQARSTFSSQLDDDQPQHFGGRGRYAHGFVRRAKNFDGRLEGGYRVPASVAFNVTPYAAVQAQTFHSPGYSETGTLGTPDPFALTFNAQSATVVRTELGGRFDKNVRANGGQHDQSVRPRGVGARLQEQSHLAATFIGLADRDLRGQRRGAAHPTLRCSRQAPNGAGAAAGRRWPSSMAEFASPHADLHRHRAHQILLVSAARGGRRSTSHKLPLILLQCVSLMGLV